MNSLKPKSFRFSVSRSRGMGRLGALFAMALLGLFLTGCGALMTAPVVPPPGLIFTQYKAPLQTDFGGEAGEGTRLGTRMGTSQTQYLNIPIMGMWTFGWDDGSLA